MSTPYRHEMTGVDVLVVEAEHYRSVFTTIRRHEALGMQRAREVYLAAISNIPDPILNQKPDADSTNNGTPCGAAR